MTSKIDSPQSLISLLGLNSDGIHFQRVNGRYGYRDCLSFNCINILYNGREDMGICLEMSGQGCRAFEEYGVSDWSVLFDLVINDSYNYNVTRLDVAFDDHTGLININRFASEVLKQNYVSVFKERSMGVYYSGKGITIYIGSNTSNVSFCIYDKARERNREDEGHWIRFEIHLSDEMALNFLKLDGDIGLNFTGVINRYIRVVVPSKTDSNKKRWLMAKWWIKFIHTSEKIRLYTPCDTEYNLKRCEDFVYRQCGNALDTLIKIKGVNIVVDELSRKKPNVSIKYLALQEQYKDNPLVQAELRGE